ncbi:MAG: hypothetical protein IKX40_08300 [Thermoguttaceae bacterium]|nr:hypothetical protein [Thermoguttaceae bacterium]
MSDSFTETTSTSWFQRIGKSFKGIVVGLCLFIAAFPLLFWNEGRTIKQTKSLKETEAGLVLAKCDEVNQDYEGKPVYMTGDAKTEEELSDDFFPVTVNGFKLKRNVEMYQWVEHEKSETKKKLGGGEETVTTYTYTKEWSDRPINSAQFNHPEEHENPAWDFEAGEMEAKTGTLGAFTLTDSIISKMNWYEPFKVEVPSTPAPQTPAATSEPELPAIPELPSLEDAPAIDDVPATPAVPETPAVDELPTLEDAPAVDDVPETPAVPESPAVDELPTLEDAPAVDELPALPSETTADEAPAAAPSAPAADAAPVTTQTTAPVVPAAALVPAQTPEAVAAANGVPEGYIYYKDGFYKGDPKKLAVGDVRVSFEYVPATETISLISGQQGDTFTPYQTKFNQIELVEKGVVSADAMFKHAHNANSMVCWALRLAGFLMMFFGLKMVFEPLRVIADVVPFIGSIVGMGIGFVAFVFAAGFSLLTIAIGWVFYRPLIGIPLLIVAIIFLLMPLFKGKKAATTAQPAAPFEKQ